MQASYRGKNTAREFDWRVASVSVMFLNQNEGVPVPRCWGPGTEAYDLPLDQILTKSRLVERYCAGIGALAGRLPANREPLLRPAFGSGLRRR